MNMHDKEELISISLQNGGYANVFRIDKREDVILFIGMGNIEGVDDAVRVVVRVDDTPYVRIFVYIGRLANQYLRVNLLEYMNRRNCNNLAVKYYIDADNEIVCRKVLIMDDFNFDADFVVDLVRDIYNIVCEDYKDLRQYL